MKTLVSNSLEETQKIAAEWLAGIFKRYVDLDEALVVGLSGHLGAGKTAFVKLVAKELGIAEIVTSPTFVLMKIYVIKPGLNSGADGRPKIPWKQLIHIDAYRLERAQELEALNFEQLVADKNNLIMIEWPENVFEEASENGPTESIHFSSGNDTYKVSIS